MTEVALRRSVATGGRAVPNSIQPRRLPHLEIRMLGPFQVRHREGGVVDRTEWRTGKAADLLRLLALQGGDPVATQTLVAALWPGSDQRHGQASLRTAASQVRRVVGPQFLERSLAGLRLLDAWVDVAAFREMSTKAHELIGIGEFAAGYELAREADRLVRGEFTAHDDGADWAQNERRALSNRHQVLLCDASESAAALGLGHEAVDFASRAIALDPFSERASRLLMRGHADVGELSLALREYERCRTLLSEELGIDPSAQTRDVHLALLRSQRLLPGRPSSRVRPTALPVEQASAECPDTPDDPCALAESRLRLALDDCIPHRQFVRARRYADEAAGLTVSPAVRARASIAYWLPDILLGGGRVAREQLAHAARLAETAGDRQLCRRLDLLNCMIAHDVADADFPAKWAQVTAHGEIDPNAEWSWLIMRVAMERGDGRTAQLAGALPPAAGAGPLAHHLHQLARAQLLAAIGDGDEATRILTTLAATLERTDFELLLPETLARLIALQAEADPNEAERGLVRLETTLNGQHGFPREAYLRLIAIAAIRFARGRTAGAAAAAAQAAEVADTHGLPHLAADAHELCARYTASAQSAAARHGARGTLSLTPTKVAI
jgi:DNA-binding SARP family transcriptional activator